MYIQDVEPDAVFVKTLGQRALSDGAGVTSKIRTGANVDAVQGDMQVKYLEYLPYLDLGI